MLNNFGRFPLASIYQQLYIRTGLLESCKLNRQNFSKYSSSVVDVPCLPSRTEVCILKRKLIYSTRLKCGQRNLGLSTSLNSSNWHSVTFVKENGERIAVKGKEGDSLLDVVVNNDVDLDGFGACEGTLSCSTCHLIFKKEDFDKLPDPASDEELDMLDLAYGLTDTSRLGCQICLSKDLDGLEVEVPEGRADAREA